MSAFPSDGLEFQTVTTNKALNPDFHIHNAYELYLLLEGDLNFYVHQSCYHLKPGALMILNDLEMHKAVYSTDGPYKRIFIHIPPAFLHHYSTEQTDLTACFVKRETGLRNFIQLESEQVHFFTQQVHEMQEARQSRYFGNDVLIDSCLLRILIMVNGLFQVEAFNDGLSVHYPPNVKEIITYVEEHILEPLSLDQIASALSLNKYYLCRIFKKETGTTIFRYILLKRISLSRILLAEGKNVTEACFQSGFQNYTNFITEFRKITGYTPKKYRNMKVYSLAESCHWASMGGSSLPTVK
ncbi:AraC family transcriptional regulator [Cohnella suwonensis]|uniref:AraC family transcriptional regulator n=1 Tax=Cohnella suwonensis TaxID=696072 RepID=A0ABW0LX34_9BACL